MGNTSTNFDWGKLLTGLGGAAASYGIDRLKKQDELSKQKKQYELLSNSMNDQMSQYQDDYSAELSGTLTASEIATRDAALNKTRGDLDKSVSLAEQQLTQQYARAGIGGEELSKALQELRSSANQQYLDYETNINVAQLEKAAARQSAAKAGLSQIKGQVAQTLTPLQVQLETAQAGLDKPETMDWAKYLLPGVAAAGVAGIGQATQPGTEAKTNADGTTTPATAKYSGPTAEQAFSETSLQGLIQNLGLDPAMFKPTNTKEEEIKDIGGELVTQQTTKGDRNFLGYQAENTKNVKLGLTENTKTDRMKLAQGPTVSVGDSLAQLKFVADETAEMTKTLSKADLANMDKHQKASMTPSVEAYRDGKLPARPQVGKAKEKGDWWDSTKVFLSLSGEKYVLKDGKSASNPESYYDRYGSPLRVFNGTVYGYTGKGSKEDDNNWESVGKVK